MTVLPRYSGPDYRLELLNSIGSDVDTLYLFADVWQIHVTEQSIYTLDFVFQRLSVYDRNTGEYIQHHDFPKGKGPGEIDGSIQFTISPSGRYYVSSNEDYRIHVFDEQFQFIRSFQEFGVVRLYFIDDVLHLLRQPLLPSPKPLVNMRTHDGTLLGSYGRQHSEFNEVYGAVRSQRLQGTGFPYLASDSQQIFIAYALPFEIRAFDKVNMELAARYEFRPSYSGGTLQDDLGILRFPSGCVVGADTYSDNVLLVFSIHNRTVQDYTHYLNILNLQNGTYEELKLSDYGLGDVPYYPRHAFYAGLLYLYTIEPFPMIRVIRIVHGPTQARD